MKTILFSVIVAGFTFTQLFPQASYAFRACLRAFEQLTK